MEIKTVLKHVLPPPNRRSKLAILLASSIIAVSAILLVGLYSHHHYIESHTKTLYEVYNNQQKLGVVSSPQVVQKYIDSRKQQVLDKNPNVQMSFDTGSIHYSKERVFNGKPDDQNVLQKVGQMFASYTTGVALVIDGKTVGYVKDKETADQILSSYKTYAMGQQKQSQSHTVSILSAKSDIVSQKVLKQDISFAQDVQTKTVDIQPDQYSNPDDILQKLKTGGIPKKTYVVQEGDCISCIATKFNIGENEIIQNNPQLKTEKYLNIGEVLNVTHDQPMLFLKTSEQVQAVKNIPYTATYENNSHLFQGVKIKISNGTYGKEQDVLQVTKVNGKVTASTVLSSTVLQKPAPAKYVKGTNPSFGTLSARSDYSGTPKGNFLSWPLSHNYVITSPFGWRSDPFTGASSFHDGLDIGAPEGSDVLAAAGGTVLTAGWYGGFGNCVIINNGYGIHTLYGHMITGSLQVHVGEVVSRGQILGHVGMTGRATGPHLHFGVYYHGTAVDPWDALISR